MARAFRHEWSLETVENLELLTNLRVIFAQEPCQSFLYGSNFNICVATANTIIQSYAWIRKYFSLAMLALLVVALS